MKVIVFDLDDTLYDELTYVRSGFMAVACHIEQRYGMDRDVVLQNLEQHLTGGRGHIFDDTLLLLGCYTKEEVKRCIRVYRSHIPALCLDEAAERCLEQFRQQPLYIVTDGHKIVQHNKVNALGLYERVKGVYITHRYGIHHAKPSPYCFLQIAKRERVAPQDIVYVGDNPRKDFVGIKPLGFQTVRIRKGNHKNIEMPEAYEAHYCISSLDQLAEIVKG